MFNIVFHLCKSRMSLFIELHWHVSRDTAFPTILHVRPAKTKISLRIRAVWSESSRAQDILRIAKNSKRLQADSEGSDLCAGWSESSLGTRDFVGNAVSRLVPFRALPSKPHESAFVWVCTFKFGILNFKVLYKIVADDILIYFFYFIFFSEEIILGTWCELSSKLTIHMKCQALLSQKNTK